jgi:hypothetical protein
LPFVATTEYQDNHTGDFDVDDGLGDMAYRPRPEPSAPFEGESETRAQFVPHAMDRPKKAATAMSHGIGVGEGKFVGQTEAREAFPGHKVCHCSCVVFVFDMKG